MSTKIISKVLSFEEDIARKSEKQKTRIQTALSSMQAKLVDEEKQTIAKEEKLAQKLREKAISTAEAQAQKVKKEQERTKHALREAFDKKKASLAKKAAESLL